jgi:hypothetical protein
LNLSNSALCLLGPIPFICVNQTQYNIGISFI